MKYVFLIAIVFSSVTYADLRTAPFDEMVIGSTHIFEAKPIKFDGKTTTLLISKVIFGVYTNKKIEIVRSNEVHDQDFKLNGMYLLFLKKSEFGVWFPSIYGRSYWPLLGTSYVGNNEVEGCDRSTPSGAYPIDQVKPGNRLKSTDMRVHYPYLPYEYSKIVQPVYCEGSILNAITHLTRSLN